MPTSPADIFPVCLCCGELATDNAVDALGNVRHRCSRPALLSCLGRNADAARFALIHGRAADAYARARNAFWYARAAGLLAWAPPAVPRQLICF